MELTLEQIKKYLNIPLEYTEDDEQIILLRDVAISKVLNYTGYKGENTPREFDLVVLQMCSSAYNNRDYTTETELKISPFCQTILDMHRHNLC